MDPTTTFCPNRNCPARGQTGQDNIGIHSQKEQRFICYECHKTFRLSDSIGEILGVKECCLPMAAAVVVPPAFVPPRC